MILTLMIAQLFCSCSGFTDEILPPQNVRIKSENLGLVLEWDPPPAATGNDFRYTAEYKSWAFFKTICRNVSSLSCDFTDDITVFGTYTLRLRTELNGKSSGWVELVCEPVEKITTIGAPVVRLQSRRGKMEVDITEPVLRKQTLKDTYRNVEYRIRYWTEGKMEKNPQEEMADQSRVMLMNLLPGVRYCIQVEIFMDFKQIQSLPSNVTCELNTASDEVESWLIVVVLLVSFLVTLISVLLTSLAVWFGYRGIRFLNPRSKLPEHFKQYLSERPSSSILLAMQNSAQPKELYHEFSIITALEVPPERAAADRSRQEQTWERLHCESALQEESQSADTLKETYPFINLT